MDEQRVRSGPAITDPHHQRGPSVSSNIRLRLAVSLSVAVICVALSMQIVETHQQLQPAPNDVDPLQATPTSSESILPPAQLRPTVSVNIRDWTNKLSEEIKIVANKTNCLQNIERYYQNEAEFQALDPVKLRDNALNQIATLLAQHRAAVTAIVAEAEKLAASHEFVKNLKVNYTDVHRLRNELDPANNTVQDPSLAQTGADSSAGPTGGLSGGQVPQFTSINGGTPVPGPVEWQTPFKSIVMRVDKNFGDIPVNTSMSAVHLPLPIYPGLPEIMNGIAWTERLDNVFKRNLANYAHVHHQYYGDHLGFMRTFPAHKWRIPRTDPDLFDARTRPWYVAGASSPKDVVILVDTSGSMTGLRREIAKGVVFEIIDSLTSNDYFAVMRFSETVTPLGLPNCNLRAPKIGTLLEEQCRDPMDLREKHECIAYRRQLENRVQYLRDHPNFVPGKNGSYLTDDQYKKSIVNVTNEISDAYLLPATSRNIRYLKSNFSLPTAGIANFTHALMAAFELLNAYNRTTDQGAQCNQAIMLITDGAIKSHDDLFNRFNYPNSPIRVFTYMIGREVGDIRHTKAMACSNRGYYAHVINLSEVREQVQKYLPVMARPLVLGHHHPVSWTPAYGDETHQVLTDWVLETKRRERARIMLNEERERLNEANSSDVINIELTNIGEYDELALVDEELKNRIICEDSTDDSSAMDQSLHDELDPLGYNELSCHWSSRRAELLTSVVKPVFDSHNTTILFQRVLHKNVWAEQETHVRNAQLLGVAAVDIRLADMMQATPSHQLGPNGYAILIGHNGFVMSHPDLRALLEDPFDKQSKILKPYFNSVDLTHIEQVYHKNRSDALKNRADDMKVLKLREAALRRQVGFESLFVKRAVDCRKRPHIRQQVFYYGPIKDTPFSLIIALPQNYGLNRLSAKLELNKLSSVHFKPSSFDLWTVHPEYRYCEGANLPRNNSVLSILQVVDSAALGAAGNVVYDDLSNGVDMQRHAGRVVCDRELFPALLFDAAATSEQPDSFCGASTPFGNCDRSSTFLGFHSSQRDDSCSRSADEMRNSSFDWLEARPTDGTVLSFSEFSACNSRSKLASIYGLEMSFLATRSGLTRVRVYDLTPRIKKLADLFILRHSRAVDESWYSRAVDWNMRFHEDATIITVPYNAYAKLIAKLRQRITQRHPAVNGTRSNCDLPLDGSFESGEEGAAANGSLPLAEEESTSAAGASLSSQIQNDGESIESSANSEVGPIGEQLTPGAPAINYNEYSSFDFLDLIANSSVHVSATQSIIANKGGKQRSPVAVSGLLYDYATFARRFLNATSLNIRVLEQPRTGGAEYGQPVSGGQVKVDICPGGECPTKCGLRNDTIDCLLVDNNGFIVVGEELPHVGRSLNDYDDRLMQSLVDKRVFHQVLLTDYQAICSRNDQLEQKSAPLAGSSQTSSSALQSQLNNPLRLSLISAFMSNLAGSALWIWTTLYSMLALQSLGVDLLGEQMQWQRSVVDAQSAVTNQSLLAFLPNKTYLRPCEKQITLYETRPIDPSKLSSESPEYFVTRCGCSGWYVYDAVPKTNLIMLIVNITSSCRRCDPTSNVVPVLTPQELGVAQTSANKAAEEQVCSMLERDSQLYVKKSDVCYAYHPEESQIHLCGGSLASALVNKLLLAAALLSSLTVIAGARAS